MTETDETGRGDERKPETGIAAFSAEPEKVRKLFDSFPLPGYVWRREPADFVLADYNQAAKDITDGKVINLLGTALSDAYPPENAVPRNITKAYQEQTSFEEEMDYTLLTTGEQRRLNITYLPYESDMVVIYTEDVTALNVSYQQLQKEKNRFITLVEGISEALVAVNSEGTIHTVNASAVEMFGYPRDELIGQKVELLVPEGKQTLHEQYRQHFMQAPETREMGRGRHLSARHKGGQTFPVEIGLSAVDSAEGFSIIALVTDITERMATEKLLKAEALTDPLTGLFNRRAFQNHLDAEEGRFERGSAPYTIVMGDIDHFKKINDTYGHDIGDEILRRIAELLTDFTRQSDIPARWGGEEFILLLPETLCAGGQILTEKLRADVEALEITVSTGAVLSVTMSLGLAVRGREDTPERVISRADTQLYEAKKRGRNIVSGCAPGD